MVSSAWICFRIFFTNQIFIRMLYIILTCDNVKHECLWLTQNKIALPSRTCGCEQGNGRWAMEQRFVVLAEGAKPKICRPPVNQTAHLINEIPGRKVVVFETLNDASTVQRDYRPHWTALRGFWLGAARRRDAGASPRGAQRRPGASEGSPQGRLSRPLGALAALDDAGIVFAPPPAEETGQAIQWSR